jgi:hypothetical protein
MAPVKAIGGAKKKQAAATKSSTTGSKPNVFRKVLSATKRALRLSNCTDVTKLARLGLRTAKALIKNQKNRSNLGNVPKSVHLGPEFDGKKGGSIIAILSAIAAVTSIISGVNSVVQAYKKGKREAEALKLHQDRNDLLETYLLAESTKKKSGGSIFLRRNKKGSFAIRICPKQQEARKGRQRQKKN